MLDLDHFKAYNDSHGHLAGDRQLKASAVNWQAQLRSSDVLARVGGEEFAVIVPASRREHAVALAERLARQAEAVELELVGSLAVSIGVAMGPEHAANPRELVACAEAAMMTAKARGKNRIVLFNDQTAERPVLGDNGRDARSIAHLKMLQSVAARLNRLSSTKEIAEAIAGTAERFDVFARIPHHNFPGGAALRRPALVLAMLYYRLKDLL